MTLMMEHTDCRPCQHRPWLSLYGTRLPVPSTVPHETLELAPIQQAIPNELMAIVFSYLDPYSLGKAAVVCRQWRILHEHPRLWERACHDAFHLAIPEKAALHKLMVTQYRFSWKRMFVHHPHLRFDGLYASRNTYVRTGVVEFTNHRPVHLVTYFRYYRFLPNGTFLYRTSPLVISKVARSMAIPAGVAAASGASGAGAAAAAGGGGAAGGSGAEAAAAAGGGSEGSAGGGPGGSAAAYWAAPRLPRGVAGPAGAAAAASERGAVLCGRYIVKGSQVHCALRYPNSGGTELRCRLALRCSRPGAHDRLDIEAIATYDRELGVLGGQQRGGDDDGEPDAPLPESARAHKRGMAPCVFVPWEQVLSSPLNLPASQMDFMIA
ncbi:hypothetical protein Agub_g154 [Astrephomene gubernaculifera]|uniref:F-box domain-containing protein n=1 Tax=Astrephomene gubernaculifera TaxID=47775 RepID=A0AAD3HG82_9CHLO|nr:hypothetical protein Agub_g154 [Astrephomene gubernaculifera]